MAPESSQAKDDVSGEAAGLADKATAAIRGAADQAADLADRALEQGREMGARAQEAPGAMRDAIDTSLKQQPLATLAVAGAVGFVLGALWKS